ncbi:pyridoxine 5'-phosphate synthase [Henriciella marina]|uniref:Pyridoxine 5'-phosphate synthase n=1 Tax=Henriciella marina TaxID=453851 RepID=A0ABT4LUC5_9PROT|nr:pyridoxine 5'-phosphate synthase [Henriciella marina]MCZ4297966.1 pyridoxine 5'-phosphate synthase [Henriciella marina]
MTDLSVNLNAVAFLRNRRGLPWPNVVDLGRIALEAGAAGLTVHPRPDERHITRADVPDLMSLITSEFPDREFNIEGYPNEAFMALVEKIRPHQITLVPDAPSQPTSDHGWDFKTNGHQLRSIVSRLKQTGARLSLFADPDPDPQQLEAAVSTGTDRIELYTGPYGGAVNDPVAEAAELERLGQTADAARKLGLGLNAGHDLTVDNLPALVARIPDLAEVSIGHGLTADALEYGMAETVRRFRRACGQVV